MVKRLLVLLLLLMPLAYPLQGYSQTTVIPGKVLTVVYEANSQANMLLLSSARVGDFCHRTDTANVYVLKSLPASVLANWVVLAGMSVTDHDVVARHPITVGGTGATTATGARTNLELGWIDSRAYATIELADVAANVAGQYLVVAQNHTLTANTTLVSRILMLPGGSFTKASTYTLTFNGGFSAPLSQVFIGFASGNVTFAAGTMTEVYAEWWGVDGTADDVQINSALASYAGTIRLLDKTYNTTATLLVGSGDHLTGSLSSIVKAFTNFGDIPLVSNATLTPANDAARDVGVKVSNITIDGNQANNGTGTEFSHGVNFIAVKNSSISGLNISNPKGDGIYVGGYFTTLVGSQSVSVTSNNIDGAIRNGIAAGHVRELDISGNSIRNITLHGIDLEPDQATQSIYNVTISNNRIYNVGKAGVALGINNTALEGRIVVNGNTIDTCTDATYGHGIDINQVTGGNVEISNNQIYNTKMNGIFVQQSSTDLLIASNTIKQPDNYCIRLTGTTRASLTGNFLHADAAHAIVIENSSNYNSISGNFIHISASLAGVRIDDSAGNLVSSNYIYGTMVAGSLGVYIYYSVATTTSNYIVGNLIFNVETCAGLSVGTADNKIGDNSCLTYTYNLVDLGSNVIRTLTVNSATPSVLGGDKFKTANTLATSITNLTGGYEGQNIRVFIRDVNTTIVFLGSSDLNGNSGANWAPSNGDWMECTYDTTFGLTRWYCSVHDTTP